MRKELQSYFYFPQEDNIGGWDFSIKYSQFSLKAIIKIFSQLFRSCFQYSTNLCKGIKLIFIFLSCKYSFLFFMKLPLLTLLPISILVSHFHQLPTSILSSQTTTCCLNVLIFIFYFQFYLLCLEQFLLLCFNEMPLVSSSNSLVKRNQKFQGTDSWVHSEYAFTALGLLTNMYYYICCTEEEMKVER